MRKATVVLASGAAAATALKMELPSRAPSVVARVMAVSFVDVLGSDWQAAARPLQGAETGTATSP